MKWQLKGLGISLILSLISCCFGQLIPTPQNCTDDVAIDIPDYWLEVSIRQELSNLHGPITCGDLHSLKNLVIYGINSEVGSLKGLEFAVNLETLVLGNRGALEIGHSVSDLTPLKNLSHLKTLHVYKANINDLSPLSRIYSLEDVSFAANQISNILPLANLPNLMRVDLAQNDIKDISPLYNLEKLEFLDLSNNSLIQPDLSRLPPMQKLTIRYSGISDLSFLKSWQIEENIELDLSTNFVHDLQPLIDNPYFGEGDKLELTHNCLDFSLGSKDLEDANKLIDRGVKMNRFGFTNQLQIMDNCSSLNSFFAPDDEITAFQDFRLQRALAKQTGFYTVTKQQLQSLEFINLGIEHCIIDGGNKHFRYVTCISDLSGLENSLNISKLILNINNLENLTPLSDLEFLEVLVLQRGGFALVQGQDLKPEITKNVCLIGNIQDIDLTPLLNSKTLWSHTVNIEKSKRQAAEDLLDHLEEIGVQAFKITNPIDCRLPN